MELYYPDVGLHVPTVLLPREGIAYDRFAVVACDQYTRQPEYWQQVERLVGDAPSALHLILPEIHLHAADRAARIARIHRTMREYVAEGILQARAPGFVLVDRQTALAPSRHGLLVALDLERYDYREGARSLIRATEGTVIDRLPPRVDIRADALLEVPHVVVLIDDPEGTVIEPLLGMALPQLYDFELMQGGGRLRAWHVGDQRLIAQVVQRLRALSGAQASPLGPPARHDPAPLLYAIGDGNHSVAAAKVVWERIKAESTDPRTVAAHPARYVLVEVANVHDEGLGFEPIHRLLLDVDVDEVLDGMERHLRELHRPAQRRLFASRAAWQVAAQQAAARCCAPFMAAGRYGMFCSEAAQPALGLAALQRFLDTYVAGHPGAQLDYIHGDETLVALAAQPRAVGFFSPAVAKHGFFATIVRDGPFPCKTFSLGEADEKRYYLEARRILP